MLKIDFEKRNIMLILPSVWILKSCWFVIWWTLPQNLALSLDLSREEGIDFEYYHQSEEANVGACRNGLLQSPIDLQTNLMTVSKGVQPLVFLNYDMVVFGVSIDNKTINLTPTSLDKNKYTGVVGGGLPGLYLLHSAHFHWNSEHTIDFNYFPLEVHLVHFRAEFGNLSAALSSNEADSVLVLGVLYREGESDRPVDQFEQRLERSPESATTIRPVDLLPDDVSAFYRYRGSLTTPPCQEGLIWIVFKSTRPVSNDQVQWLKTRRLGDGVAHSKNFRKIQRTNRRPVTYVETATYNNYPPMRLCKSEASGALFSWSFGFMSLAIALNSVSF